MNPLSNTSGYSIGKENKEDYPNFLGLEVEKVEGLLRAGRISKDQAAMLLGILTKKASGDIKREIENLVSEGHTSKMLFLRYSWNG